MNMCSYGPIDIRNRKTIILIHIKISILIEPLRIEGVCVPVGLMAIKICPDYSIDQQDLNPYWSVGIEETTV